MIFKTPKIQYFLSEQLIFTKINIFYVFACVFFLVSENSYSQEKEPHFTLTLDAGHGGHDGGANSYGKMEKDVTLAVVRKLGEKIEKEDKDVKIIYTRKDDSYPELYRRAEIANQSKSDLFISIHCNSASNSSAKGTETWVLGAQNSKKKDANFSVVAKENSVVFLEKNYKENYDGYDPNSPETVIGMTLMQDKFLENSLRFAQLMEENFQSNEGRTSRGVKQGPFLVLVKTAMPAVLIETGFISNYEDRAFLTSEEGQNKMAESIYKTFEQYKKEYYKKSGYDLENTKKQEVKIKENPVPNTEFKVQILVSRYRYSGDAIQFKGLKNVEVVKKKDRYHYFYGSTSYKSESEENLKEAKRAGFTDAMLVDFDKKEKEEGKYTIELMMSKDKYSKNSSELKGLDNVERIKIKPDYQYLYGTYNSYQQASLELEKLKKLGFTNAIIVIQR